MGLQPLSHESIVEKWMLDAPPSSTANLVDLFESGLGRMWLRAQPTLGEVTLGAILDRVLYTATERFAFLAPLQVRDGRVDFHDLRESSDAVAPAEVAEAMRFVVLEFLTVLGHLTAEILTPALHAELVKVEPERAKRPTGRRRT